MSTGFTVSQTGSYKADLDDILMRREYFSDGTLWTWGFNGSSRLGDGTTTSRLSPGTTSGSGTNWKSVACAYDHTAAIKTDGTLWTWGRDAYGQLGDNSNSTKSSPGTTVGGGTNWKSVACGYGYTAAIKTDGTLWTWGYNLLGMLGTGAPGQRSSPGTTAGGGTNWKSVSCGPRHSAAIKTDGTLWSWGYNGAGHLGTGDTSNRSSPGTTVGGGTNWKSVSCGAGGIAAIKTDGTLWTCGYNLFGMLGDNTTTNRTSLNITAAGGTNWKSVSCGYQHTAAIKTDGKLWTWGKNTDGQLGDNTATSSKLSPGTTAGGGTNWQSVSGGYRHTAAIKTDGTLWTCGYNIGGTLGDNTTTNRSSLGTISGGGANWKSVAGGNRYTAATTDLSF